MGNRRRVDKSNIYIVEICGLVSPNKCMLKDEVIAF